MHEASEQADTRLSELLYYFCILPHNEPKSTTLLYNRKPPNRYRFVIL